jgi:hypothetical protein
MENADGQLGGVDLAKIARSDVETDDVSAVEERPGVEDDVLGREVEVARGRSGGGRWSG